MRKKLLSLLTVLCLVLGMLPAAAVAAAVTVAEAATVKAYEAAAPDVKTEVAGTVESVKGGEAAFVQFFAAGPGQFFIPGFLFRLSSSCPPTFCKCRAQELQNRPDLPRVFVNRTKFANQASF